MCSTSNNPTIHFLKGKEEQPSKDLELSLQKFIQDCFHQKNVYFLFGSGTSATALPTMEELYRKVQEAFQGKDNLKDLFKKVDASEETSPHKNLEQILGLLYSHERYLAGVNNQDNGDDNGDIEHVREAIQIIQSTIYNELCHPTPNDLSSPDTNHYKALETYKDFYRKVVYRNKDLSRIHVFTTNNDLFNETALDELGILYTNGFTPGLQRFFNPALFNFTYSRRMDMSLDKYEPIENMVYLYKLHGSVSWRDRSSEGGASTLFPIQEISLQPSDASQRSSNEALLIYPAPTKQNLSLGSPYVDLIRIFQEKLLEHNSVLFVCGYSFSDEHINNMIYRALAINASLNLVILNDLKKDHILRNTTDERVYHIWSESEGQSIPPIHYFSEVVSRLLKTLDQERSDTIPEELVKSYVKSIHR